MGTLRFGLCPYPSSMQNERRKNMLAYFYDRVQPQTPKASKGSRRRPSPYPIPSSPKPLITNHQSLITHPYNLSPTT